YEMELRPGDIQSLNNHVVYHGRTAYVDAPGAGHDRLLFRLWLAPPNSRPLPEGFEVLWGTIKGGAVRGGIAQPAASARGGVIGGGVRGPPRAPPPHRGGRRRRCSRAANTTR